jgi:osmotically-inducible protein OsmY
MLRSNRALLTGLGLGLGLMYFMDPERGRRRRALARDKVTHTTRACAGTMSAVWADLAHRSAGLVARARRIGRRDPVDDDVLVERVRAKLGRLVSYPHAIDVSAIDGCVHLRGVALQSEVPGLVRTISRVSGVRDVIDALDAHPSAAKIAALQGHAPPKSTATERRG